jgi:uncharacterized membrane protein
MASVLLIFIVYFGLDSLVFLFTGDESASIVRYRLAFSFVVGMSSGIAFYLYSKRSAPMEISEKTDGDGLDKSISILERALSEDEMTIIDMVRGTGELTQDSIRFRSGFSKSKVSALVLNLEKKGILQRERLGRTYKIFLSDWLK